MVEVKFYDSIDDKLLKFAVIISKTNGKWIFCKHRERDTYEVPGGHRESGEDIFSISLCISSKENTSAKKSMPNVSSSMLSLTLVFPLTEYT